jgi:DNA-binding transcriptional LysR family regulator
MELRHLRYFLAALEEGTISRAAERLHVVQPALSRQISDLEAELGARLLVRGARGVTPTPAGKAFAREAAKILDDLAKAASRVNSVADQKVEVGVVQNATFFPFVAAGLSAFRTRFPDTKVKLHRMTLGEIDSAVSRSELDVAVLYEGSCVIPNSRTVDIHSETLSVIVPASHRLSMQDSIDLIDLSEEYFVWYARKSSPFIYDHLMMACRTCGFEPKVAYELEEGSDSAVELLLAGGGCAFAASVSARRISSPELVVKPVRNLGLDLKLQLVWRKGRPAATQFARAILPAIREHRRTIAKAAA